jgi:hypothetical protein
MPDPALRDIFNESGKRKADEIAQRHILRAMRCPVRRFAPRDKGDGFTDLQPTQGSIRKETVRQL